MKSQKKPKPDATPAPGTTNIISETSKRTLDSKSPGVAIIVQGVSGNEVMALPLLEQTLRSSSAKPSNPELQKQMSPAEAVAKDDVEHFVFNKQLVLVVRPVPTDLFAFAQKIKWGKVKEIDLQNRIITVDTQLQKLNSLAVRDQAGSMQADPPVKVSANSQSIENSTPAKPAMNQPDQKVEKPDKAMNDRDLKPRPGEETIDWALRVIAGSSSFAHDTACKQLASMEPDNNHLQRVSSVLATTLPLAKEGFRMKEHVNAMAVWQTDEATRAFAALLADERLVLVRKEIIGLLPTIHSETTAEVLVGRLSNRGDLKSARQSLKIMGQIAEKPVIQLLNDPNSSMRIEACNILQSIGTQKAVEALKKQAETEESSVVKQQMSETQADIEKELTTQEK
ncbi:HEAT repeat domain-containing protein [uncultured Gimesia sp.]|uniref:HEAT repeat domain-containing protein n=1 Tax=uncultured Gimesia sp. TaxID=1678688 RepID=UPI0030DAA3FA|tara:strand:- start:9697 stop:10884 length:1188 start_codon:yes stop_codon:yes gene_type:complete